MVCKAGGTMTPPLPLNNPVFTTDTRTDASVSDVPGTCGSCAREFISRDEILISDKTDFPQELYIPIYKFLRIHPQCIGGALS
jgi:hypothetical protein